MTKTTRNDRSSEPDVDPKIRTRWFFTYAA